MQNINIKESHLQEIQKLLTTYLPHTEVWAYGSRVTGTASKFSDLDLVVFATLEQELDVFALAHAFENSFLPFRVDLFIWDKLPEAFHNVMQQQYVVLQTAKK